MALTIQERLKDLRVERGLTLEQLAGGRKFFCVFKIGSSIQLELDM